LTQFDDDMSEIAKACAVRYRGIAPFGIGVLVAVALVTLVFFATL
jgi:hypothetical protein